LSLRHPRAQRSQRVKLIENAIEIATGEPQLATEPQLAEGSMPTESNAAGAIGEVTYDRMARHARALRLSRELRILVVVDAAGWLKDQIEIVYHRERRRAIRPTSCESVTWRPTRTFRENMACGRAAGATTPRSIGCTSSPLSSRPWFARGA